MKMGRRKGGGGEEGNWKEEVGKKHKKSEK